MKNDVKNVKIICDPLWGLVDITEYLPMIDVPPFQALGFKYQLGVTNLIFPSATHTRKQHSFGAFARTKNLAERWHAKGFVTKDETRLLCAFALWHDIGHGPFSHVVEEVTREIYNRDHDQNGAEIIEKLKPAVAAAQIDFAEFKKFFNRENPLYKAVHDKNLGTEKLDYLSRDAYYTIGEVPGVEYLALHTYYIDGQVVIDEKAIDQAKSIQDFYVKMYKDVYLRKNATIAQRLVQKMTVALLTEKPLPENEFWSLTDFGLLGLFETSESEEVKSLYRHFMTRNLPKTAIVLRSNAFADMEKRKDKAQTIFGLSDDLMLKITKLENFSKPSKIAVIENEIEKIAGLPKGAVLVTPPTDPGRFVPQDINIYIADGKIAKLSDYFADHFKALLEEGRHYTVLRVCTFEEHRSRLAEPKTAAAVKDYLTSLLG
jgi:HD superfamily phosphohydrolase